MEGSKENQHQDPGIVGANVNFRALEKSIRVLEKYWKFVSEKGYEPWKWLWSLARGGCLQESLSFGFLENWALNKTNKQQQNFIN